MNSNFKCVNSLYRKCRFLSLISSTVGAISPKKHSVVGSVRLLSTSKTPLRMRFVQFRCLKEGPQRLGVQLTQEGDVIDVSAVDSSIPNNLVQFLEGGSNLMEKTKR